MIIRPILSSPMRSKADSNFRCLSAILANPMQARSNFGSYLKLDLTAVPAFSFSHS
jgi:hypothetical protein